MSNYYRNIKLILVLLLGNLFCVNVIGQELVYNAFILDSIGVGENLDLYVTLDQKENPNISEIDISTLSDMRFFPPVQNQGDSLKIQKADISINDWGLWKDEDNNGVLEGSEINWEKSENGDTIIYRNKINLSFFDVGLYVFDGFEMEMNGREIRSNRASLLVNFKDYNLEKIDSTGLAPIKNIDREFLNFSDAIPILAILLLLSAIIYAIYFFRKRRRKNALEIQEEEEIILPPDVKALLALKDLRAKELWQQGKIKSYQSELSHIVRQYLEDRYEIHALESTTNQIIRSIKDSSFEESDQMMLKRILQISDLVKFAKAKPEINVHEEFMNEAVTFIERTKLIEEENSEEE